MGRVSERTEVNTKQKRTQAHAALNANSQTRSRARTHIHTHIQHTHTHDILRGPAMTAHGSLDPINKKC
jgi:hypothetical protein